MMRSLIAGEADPALLANLARGRMRTKIPGLNKALTGRFGEHHAFLASVQAAEAQQKEQEHHAKRDEEQLPQALTRPSAEELEVARELVRSARERGTALTGPGGLLKALTKTVIETTLDEEMADHLGYDKHDAGGRGSGNSRNGTRTKTVLTDSCGPVDIELPRDRAGSFDPAIVKKWQRRSGDVDTIVLSLYAKGLTTGEISAHFAWSAFDQVHRTDTMDHALTRLKLVRTWSSDLGERVA